MQKQLGPILLVAGTCIGSGMIALPIVLAKLGLLCSILLMLLIWLVMYHTSLINLELNLQAGKGLALGSLGRLFSGKKAGWAGTISLKLLSYSLLAVFLYGGSSILQKLFSEGGNLSYKIHGFALATFALFLLPVKWIDYLNRYLFTALLAAAVFLISGLATKIDWSDLPLFSEDYKNVSVWRALVPIVFTSFGFQVIFHTLTNYCETHAKTLKKAFFWGSLIPAVVYIIWTGSVMSVIHHHHPIFYKEMIRGKVEIGDLIQTLCSIAGESSVQMLVWWISLLAIVTSILGVGMGLSDALGNFLAPKIPHKFAAKATGALLTIVPPYLVALLVPNAFIVVLGFAGMILALIAILLPAYLLRQAKVECLNYPELKIKWLTRSSVGIGLTVIGSELCNLFSKM